MRKTLAAAALGLLAAACTDGGSTADPTQRPASDFDRPDVALADDEITFVSALRQVGDCDALLAHLRAEAGSRVGPYGLGASGPWYYPTDGARAAMEDGDDAATGGEASAPDTGASFSTTNTQEQGVDEPDVVKTDGDRIVTIANGTLSVVDATAEPATRVGSVELGTDTNQPIDLLVVGDRALVFGSGWVAEPDGETGDDATRIIGPWMPGRQLATITEVDLGDPTNPTVGTTLRVDGWYLNARLVGDTARVVLRSEPTELPFVSPQNQRAEARAEELNRAVVAESTLEDWMPAYELVEPDGTVTSNGLLASCEDVDAPTEFAGFGTLSVLTFDLNASLGTGDAVSVLAAGDTVYASTDHLYVATTTYLDPLTLEKGDDVVEQWNDDFSTSIHAFDIGRAEPASYVASGTVPGHLLNQFALSEHEGRLRVATTEGTPWGGDSESESFVTVLEQQGESLAQVGQVGDLGRGEQIYSVRYAGDVAYVVTFRQTDPFYTVDLSEPTAPRVAGELKIPGYSAYLHPIGDNLVIGVGQDAGDTGRVQGTKVSLFDVADLAAPAELATWSLPDSSSNVEWDHHAFLWWPATRQLVLPVNVWTREFFGAIVLTVDRAGITEVGRVQHDEYLPAAEEVCGVPIDSDEPTARPSGYGECVPSAQPNPIQRSLVLGDDLWTMAQVTLQANSLADLTPGAVVPIN